MSSSVDLRERAQAFVDEMAVRADDAGRGRDIIQELLNDSTAQRVEQLEAALRKIRKDCSGANHIPACRNAVALVNKLLTAPKGVQ